jgi:uncharacterized phiE125 gp8 family phage protein
MSYIKLIEPPDTEPISLVNAKLNLRVDFTDDDERIKRHIKEAREWVERRIQQKVAESTWEVGLDAFPSGDITLTIIPVQSIASFKYDDVSNVEQTLVLTTDYTYANGIISPVDAWPTAFSGTNVVRIQVLTGYEDSALIPTPVVSAIYLKIKELYDGEDTSQAVHSLLTNYYTMVA